jgi:uncharacterized membrane protein YdjX (TVP38/TMEM64 family)
MLRQPLAPERSKGQVRRLSRAVLSPWGRCAVLVVLLAGAACSVLLWHPRHLLSSGWPELSGVGAALLFTAVFAGCTVAFVPKPLLNVAAGALFGIGEGLLLAVVGTALGALVAFLLGRSLGRDALRPLLRTKALTALERQLSEHGFRSVLLMRLVPGVPFAVANYSAAVSRMSTWSFTVATAVGVVPNTAAYVVAGSRATTPDSPVFLTALGAIAVMGALSLAATWRRTRGRRRKTP